MPVFINRVLNMKNIKVIGFDMDYTLVRYHTEAFEKLTHSLAAHRLADRPDYPEEVKHLDFDFQRAIKGMEIFFRSAVTEKSRSPFMAWKFWTTTNNRSFTRKWLLT
jgi:FMN phosphatase YigB (HAD superfamily)